MEETKEVKKEKQEKKRLSPDSTLLLTVAAFAGVIVIIGLIDFIIRSF